MRQIVLRLPLASGEQERSERVREVARNGGTRKVKERIDPCRKTWGVSYLEQSGAGFAAL
jgi:hypothetical protein